LLQKVEQHSIPIWQVVPLKPHIELPPIPDPVLLSLLEL
jgi:hypothetical protein